MPSTPASADSVECVSLRDTIPDILDFDIRKIFNEELSAGEHYFLSKDDLRQNLYTLLADTKDLKKRCNDLFEEFIRCMEHKTILVSDTSVDLLCLLVFNKMVQFQPDYEEHGLGPTRYKVHRMPLFPELRLQSNNKNANSRVPVELGELEKIGRQHIVVCSIPDSISDSSQSLHSDSTDSGEVLDNVPRKKQKINNIEWRKVCETAKDIDLRTHSNNFDRDKNVYCQVDVLILIDVVSYGKNIGINVARHLGFIALEDLFGNALPCNEILNNPNAKFYKLAQTLIAKKLMNGSSNVLITTDVFAWKHIQANVRGILTDGSTNLESDDANYFVVVQKKQKLIPFSAEDITLSCIEAISEIICKSVGFNITVPVKYVLVKKKSTLMSNYQSL